MIATSGPALSIVMPVYNGAPHLSDTLESILREPFDDFEVVVSDDCSTDTTAEIVQSMNDGRIRFQRNEKNLGYPGNLQASLMAARGELVMLFAQDDVLLSGSLQRTVAGFTRSPRVGVVTRPYFWFDNNIDEPIRVVRPYDSQSDIEVSIHDGPRVISSLFQSFGQLSGLAVRRSLVTTACHPYVFTAHIAPIAAILREYTAMFLCEPTVAVRASSSQTRTHPEIYSPTPLATWIRLGDDVFAGPAFHEVRRQYRQFLGVSNHVGLIQLRNYAPPRVLLDETRLFVYLRPWNLADPRFLFMVFCAFTIPARILRPLTDWYKRSVLARVIRWRR